MIHPNLTSLTMHLIGQKYHLGQIDCFNIIVEYLRHRGATIPDQFKGVTLQSYGSLYKEHPEEARTVMVEFVDSLMKEVNAKRTLPGDVLLLKFRGKTSAPFLAIRAAGGIVVFAEQRYGVMTNTIRHYRVLRAWRWVEQS